MSDRPIGDHVGHPVPDDPAQTAAAFGRVDDEGRVYVVTGEGERMVGQWTSGDADAALAFYTNRFTGLVLEVDLLQQRIESGAITPDDGLGRVAHLRESLATIQAVGDLDAVATRLDAVVGLIEQSREKRRAERAAKSAEAKAEKEKIAVKAEEIANGSDWRGGANDLRDMLTAWKALPRIDKASDDQLWHRFSSARTTYTRRRKQHFAEINERRQTSREIKESLISEAEALSSSRDWGETSNAYRELMKRWKAAGSAQKDEDDALWKRFRGAQDTFFEARDAENSRVDSEYAANAKLKRAILAEAEKLFPVTNARVARDTFRDIAQRWDAIGRVPRGDIKDLEQSFRRIEQAVRNAEDDRWRRSNPEAHARALATITQLEESIAKLTKQLSAAVDSGNESAATRARADIEARQSWLDEARRTLREFAP